MFQSRSTVPGAEHSERPRRNKRQTIRAQEILNAGESVPGLPVTPTETPSPDSAGSGTLSRSSFRESLGIMPATKFATKSRNPGDTAVPTLTADKFLIYNWEVPRPKSFIDLPESRKAWKRRADQEEEARDINDGSDDWYEFCGKRNVYEDHREDRFAMEYCAASTFVKRAKRAFWMGKGWQEFEVHERTLNSEAQARAEPDPKKSALLMEYALNNTLRLAIFNALKARLCEEIWLEPYEMSDTVLRLTIPKSDSKMPTPSPKFHPLDEQWRRAPTPEEMSRGITGWSIDRFGVEQPLYNDETEPPNGMRYFMRDLREQKQREASAVARSTRNADKMQRGRIGNVGINKVIPMTAAEEIALREPDFDTSDEGEE